MGKILQSTGGMIWVSILICLCLIGLSTADPLSGIKEFHTNFIGHDRQSMPSIGQPQIFDQKAHETGLDIFPPDLMPKALPVNQHIVMDNSHPEQQVQDIYALNNNMQRDIVFDDTQRGDPLNKGLKNSMDIGINGQGQSESNGGLDESSDDRGIENMVDNAMVNNAIGDNAQVSKQHDGPVTYQSKTGSPSQQRLGNYMNIDVSGINIQATNTVKDGSAVATSNIVIKPVQIINCPPEVDEKLK